MVGKIGHRTSFSLDLPVDLQSTAYPSFATASPMEMTLSRDANRYYLYLPRNLSYCQLCADVIRQHVQKKVQLLSAKINQLENLPDDSGCSSPESCGLWLGDSHTPSSFPGTSAEWTDGQSSTLKTHQRRSSILRKTKRAKSYPPPPQKREGRKVVRFADSLGLDLESVRYMMKSDLPPSIPLSAFSDLRRSQVSSYDIELVPSFIMPSFSSNFTDRVRDLAVSLHSVSTANTTVYGIVAVLNLTFHKNIFIRYSVDNWNSHHDTSTTYIQGSSEGDIDKFSFNIFVSPQDLSTRNHSLDFAVCYQTQDGKEFWDNNNGLNYRLKCETKGPSFVSNIDHSWIHFL
ncbi:glycogen-binding subunit 76A-like isoform X2 [Limulus polyphemus]|nr:glycogen-binding subunit 76A-like isoform X2 [Limulus polyphemus]XP_022248474.1 glycogen-binding subunit 76A-like isoform X2 [Limulus polyphemus]XP_022248475.1 glycogen-binding subunit 76A-like isoform X2 [Limulus polyphemus]